MPNSQEKNWLLSYAKNSKSQQDWANTYVDEDMQVGRVSVQLADIGTSEMELLKTKLSGQIDQIFDPEKYDIKLTGTSQKVIYQDLPVNDPKQRKPDISKAKQTLGWQPKVSREEGLKITYEYFKGLSHEELNKKEHNDFEQYITR